MKTEELLKKLNSKEPVCYYTDHAVLKNFDRESEPGIMAGNLCLQTYKRVTGFELKTYESLSQMIQNPDEFYREQFYQANQKDFATLSKLKLDYKTLIELPEGFEEVRTKAAKFAKHNTANFEMKDGQIVHSKKAITRRDSRAYLIATTSEEKDRLKNCLEMIQVFERIEAELEATMKPSQFKTLKESKAFAKPLHHCLKIVADENGKAILIPNPQYVKESFGGVFYPTKAQIQNAKKDAAPKLGVPHLKVKVKMQSGATHYYLVEQTEEAKFRAKFGPAAEWLDGLWNENDRPYGEALKTTIAKPESTLADMSVDRILNVIQP